MIAEAASTFSERGAPSTPFGVASRTDTETLLSAVWGGIVSAALGTISISGDGLTSAKGSDEEGSLDSGGSGRHSIFDRLQRVQNHSFDLGYLAEEVSEWREVKEIWGDTHKPARRLRSLVGTSSAPTPMAA